MDSHCPKEGRKAFDVEGSYLYYESRGPVLERRRITLNEQYVFVGQSVSSCCGRAVSKQYVVE